MSLFHQKFIILLFSLLLISISSIVLASVPANDKEKFNVVIHISKNLKADYLAALTQAKIIQKHYGKDQVNIEILVNGTGIGFVNRQNQYVEPITDLINDGVRFSACNATIRRILKDNNYEVPLIEGVKFVPFGIVHLIELQRNGYYYLKP